MPESGWDVTERGETRFVSVRRSAVQFLICLAVIAAIPFGILAGGIALAGGFLPPSDPTEPYCNPITDHCTNTFNLAGIETQTGYTFPAGSVLLKSSTQGGRFGTRRSAP